VPSAPVTENFTGRSRPTEKELSTGSFTKDTTVTGLTSASNGNKDKAAKAADKAADKAAK